VAASGGGGLRLGGGGVLCLGGGVVHCLGGGGGEAVVADVVVVMLLFRCCLV
jgi:hypothetical protein